MDKIRVIEAVSLPGRTIAKGRETMTDSYGTDSYGIDDYVDAVYLRLCAEGVHATNSDACKDVLYDMMMERVPGFEGDVRARSYDWPIYIGNQLISKFRIGAKARDAEPTAVRMVVRSVRTAARAMQANALQVRALDATWTSLCDRAAAATSDPDAKATFEAARDSGPWSGYRALLDDTYPVSSVDWYVLLRLQGELSATSDAVRDALYAVQDELERFERLTQGQS